MKKGEVGRKIPSSLENPIDNLFITLAEKTAPFFHKVGFFPNTVTTIAFLLVVPLIYFYHIFNNFLALFFLLLMYYFDCLDGYEARKYHLESEFGDFYDHLQEIVVFFVLSVFIFLRLYSATSSYVFYSLLLVTIVLLLLMQIHIGNQEKYFKLKHATRAKKSIFLRYLIKRTPNWPLKYTRWFGAGTFVLWNAILIFVSNIIAY